MKTNTVPAIQRIRDHFEAEGLNILDMTQEQADAEVLKIWPRI